MSSGGNSTYKKVYILKGANNFTPIQIKSLGKKGGEGEIYTVLSDSSRVAKIYHKDKLKPEHQKKLPILLEIAQKITIPKTNSSQIAWCLDLVYGSNQKKDLIGFIMPLVQGETILNAYNPRQRQANFPHFHYRDLHQIALNLAKVFEEIHKHNIVIGDVNESNVLVTNNAKVILIDIDSVQVYDRKGKCHRCTVGKPEYTPPELEEKFKKERSDFKSVNRTPEHDLYGLGVLIYQLLMEGKHPFPAIDGQKPSAYKCPPLAPRFDTLHPEVRKLMERFLYSGYNSPQERPSAENWVLALQEAQQSFKQCSNNEQHYYQRHLQKCFWCERAWKLKTDTFLPISGYKRYNPTKTYKTWRIIQTQLQGVQISQKIQPLIPIRLKSLFSKLPKLPKLGKVAHGFQPKTNKSGKLGVAVIAAFGIFVGVLIFAINPIWEASENITANGKQGEYEKAIADYTKVIQLNPKYNYDNAYDNRGNAYYYYNRGEYEKAIADYTKVIQLNPKYINARAYNNRGIVYYKQGEYEKAIADYTQALRLHSKYAYAKAYAYYNRGNAYREQGKYEKALADYTKVIQINTGIIRLFPKDAYAYYYRGNAYRKQGKYEKALADYAQAILLDPKDAYAYYYRGNAYHNQGKYEKAIADYNRAIRLFPKDSDAYYNRGNTYHNQGKYEKAIADYTKIIQLYPKYADAYYNRGLAYQLNKGSCKNNLNSFFDGSYISQFILDKICTTYFYMAPKDIEKAISDFEKAADLYKQQTNQKSYQDSLDKLKELRGY
ncbi:MAG: tetratricopeptide repeat protein [Okeania sp. SIO3B5]|nr:tetratricopeptide repeat protein [Okeania sp. SIO3B5]